jgi:riboflavin biosynthesis pyrimidine reductase
MQLYPMPQRELGLEGLYLHSVDACNREYPLVYTNFITSLDGRIAIEHPVTGERGVPEFITNPRDWRLYQELAARADVLLVSARYLRELARGEAQDNLPLSNDPAFADLTQWRMQQGLSSQPDVVILSASLDLPLKALSALQDRQVFVATGEQADAKAVRSIECTGAKVLYAGDNRKVDGKRLIEQLVAQGFSSIYSIAGPGVLETLLRARVLDRIYLTQVHRLIGGASYDTVFEGRLLSPPADFKLQTLYYDDRSGKDCGQFFAIYEMTAEKSVQKNPRVSTG